MSLPPDPHDDDLAEPPAPPPPAPGEAPVAAAPGPPPSPAYAPRPSPTAPAALVADAPAAPTEARGGRGRLGLLLAGVVVVIVVAGGIVIASGDDGDTAAPADAEVAAAGDVSPVELAEEFFAAVAQGDCGGMIERMTPESYGSGGLTATEAVAECRADAAGTAAVAAADFDDIELVSEDGDSAVVRVTVTVDGVERERELPLRQVDDRWLMHLDTSLVAAAG